MVVNLADNSEDKVVGNGVLDLGYWVQRSGFRVSILARLGDDGCLGIVCRLSVEFRKVRELPLWRSVVFWGLYWGAPYFLKVPCGLQRKGSVRERGFKGLGMESQR